jgi:hypothetical protein
VLKYQDWVWSVVARGGLLLVASGPEVHVHDLPTGKLVRKVRPLQWLQVNILWAGRVLESPTELIWWLLCGLCSQYALASGHQLRVPDLRTGKPICW